MKSIPKLHPVMFAGTGSDVGKSVLATAFCRIFRQDGYNPAPFKAQNMALNSFATPDGFEIGRAQAVQAEAAGVQPHTDMNPILLKPQSDCTCQVVLNGSIFGNKDAFSYFKKEGREMFRSAAFKAFDRLKQNYNPIVMEGAGSISEINLRETDIVNMPMAMYAGADIILVADIDRGGVFASAYGSIMLQRPEERRMIKGIIINKFRGDLRLFKEGVKMMEEICQVPVLGVVPYFKDIHIEEEDSLQLASKRRKMGEKGTVNVAVIMLRHMSNFTDFDALEQDPRITLFYTNNPQDLLSADIIILPGTKNTIDDIIELRLNGMASAILRERREGKTILGICGGYQIMGYNVTDPEHVESEQDSAQGLGLLPVSTVMSGPKTTRQTVFTFCNDPSTKMHGYEIHNGTTQPINGETTPLFRRNDGTFDGYFLDDHCMGTYMHGVFDNTVFIDFLLHPHKAKTSSNATITDYTEFKELQYNLLAKHVRQHVDMQKIYEILTEGTRT